MFFDENSSCRLFLHLYSRYIPVSDIHSPHAGAESFRRWRSVCERIRHGYANKMVLEFDGAHHVSFFRSHLVDAWWSPFYDGMGCPLRAMI